MSVLDDQMVEVADFFAGRKVGDTDVLVADRLRRSRLDFSLASLAAVDEWLETLASSCVALDERSAESVIWAGVYVGEVIRRNAKRQWRWMQYEEYMSTRPASEKNLIPYTFGSQFVLVASDSDAMTLPINKVVRRLAEGPEDNIQFYAQCTIA
jgi:hypothetical protein